MRQIDRVLEHRVPSPSHPLFRPHSHHQAQHTLGDRDQGWRESPALPNLLRSTYMLHLNAGGHPPAIVSSVSGRQPY